LIIILGLVLRLWGIKGGLPFFLADEDVYVVGALRVGQGEWNPGDFNNPSLMIYINFFAFGFLFLIGNLIGIFSSLTDFKNAFYQDPTLFYLTARLVMVGFGGLSIFVLYGLARRVLNEKVAELAALILAIYPAHIVASQNAKCDVAMVFLVLLSLLYLIRYLEYGTERLFLISCFICGLAISTKYTAAPLSMACILAFFIQSFSTRPKIYSTLLAGVLLILFGFFIATPYSLLDYKKFFFDINFLLAKNRTQWFGMEGAQIGFLEYTFKVFPMSAGWPLYLCTLCGILLTLMMLNRKKIILYSFPLLLYAALAQTRHVAGGYALPLYPFFCILSAQAILRLNEHVRSAIIKSILIIFIFFNPIMLDIVSGFNKSTKDTRIIAKDWIERHISQDKRIASEVSLRVIPNSERISEIMGRIKDPKRGGHFRYYAENISGKRYYFYEFPLFECPDPASRKVFFTDEDERKCTKPSSVDYDFIRVKRNYDFMILSSHVYHRFRALPSLYPKQNDFYDEIEKQAELVMTFNNNLSDNNQNSSFSDHFKHFFGFIDNQGFTINIYKLN